MKKALIAIGLLASTASFTQIPAYYSSIDFTQSGSSIASQLTTLITTTHNQLTYSECWDALKEADLETSSTTLVTLVYGYDDGDGNVITDRTRDKNLNGGNVGDWNREHVFPKSLGSPDLGTSGPGADAHNLRASDVQQNGNRSNKKFIDGSGNAGPQGTDWYPGDEWKGDCARIVMYMYLRYGTRCVPAAVGTGTTNIIDPNMTDLFLVWNNDDPVSQFEKDRNDGIQNHQGNRNPFIDNPRIAYKIWGGPMAEDTWGNLNTTELTEELITVFPMPVNGDIFYVGGLNTLNVKSISMHNISGQIVDQIDINQIVNNGGVSIDHLENGTYILSLIFDNKTIQRKVIIQ